LIVKVSNFGRGDVAIAPKSSNELAIYVFILNIRIQLGLPENPFRIGCFNQWKLISSTSKIRVALGGIGPDPLFP
jgi:hypothetical protein